MSILDDVAGIIADAAGDLVFKDATLTRPTKVAGATAYDPPASTGTATYTCKALRDTFGSTWLAGGLVSCLIRWLELPVTKQLERAALGVPG